MKSYKKFPAPLKRLEAIACEAELQEKPLADLLRLGQDLRARCLALLGPEISGNELDSDLSLSGIELAEL